jgi:hypothetical protein
MAVSQQAKEQAAQAKAAAKAQAAQAAAQAKARAAALKDFNQRAAQAAAQARAQAKAQAAAQARAQAQAAAQAKAQAAQAKAQQLAQAKAQQLAQAKATAVSNHADVNRDADLLLPYAQRPMRILAPSAPVLGDNSSNNPFMPQQNTSYQMPEPQNHISNYKKGGVVKAKMASKTSSRGDGIAQRGKTRGTMR